MPGFEYPVELEPQIVMQTGCVVFINDDVRVCGRIDAGIAAWFLGFLKIPLRLIRRKIVSRDLTTP